MHDSYSWFVSVLFAVIGVLKSPKVLLLLVALIFIGRRGKRRRVLRG